MLDKKQMSLNLLEETQYNALFEFEMENRYWFEQHVPARPEGYFTFPVFKFYQDKLIEEYKSGLGYFYLAMEDHRRVIGRLNLYNLTEQSAELGYRLSKNCSGNGITTHLVSEIIKIARLTHLKFLTAEVEEENIASRRVLEKNNFERTKSGELQPRQCFRLNLKKLL